MSFHDLVIQFLVLLNNTWLYQCIILSLPIYLLRDVLVASNLGQPRIKLLYICMCSFLLCKHNVTCLCKIGM